MAARDFYQIQRADVGEPILGPYLRAFFDENAKMNREAMAAEGEDSPEDLSKLEMEARERIANLSRVAREASANDYKSYNDLLARFMEASSNEKIAGGKVAADIAKIRADIAMKYRDDANAEAESLGRKVAVGGATQRALDTLGKEQVTNSTAPTTALAGDIADQIRQLAAAEGAGGEADAKYVAMVRDAYESIAPVRKDVADEIQRLLLPESARKGQTPGDYFMEVFAPTTLEKAWKDSREHGKYFTAGVAPGAKMALESTGMNLTDLAPGGVGERRGSSTSGGGAPGGGSVPVDQTTSISGMSAPAASAFARSKAAGGSPEANIQAAINADLAYIEDLRKRREALSVRRGAFPRANIYTTTPNRMVPEETWRAVRKVGNMDPGAVEEWSAALARNPNINAAVREMGGTPERRYAVQDFRPERYEGEGKGISEVIASNLTVSNVPATVAGKDGFTYTVAPNGEVSYVKDGKTTKVPKGSKAYAAIMKEIGPMLPASGTNKVFASLPREVQALYQMAKAYADEGDLEAAARAARDVSDDDVRAAFGAALQRGAHDPSALGEVMDGISALPESATGEWGYAVRDMLDEHERTTPKIGQRATEILRGNAKALGGALEVSTVTGAKRHRTDVAETQEEQKDQNARGEYAMGLDSVAKALQSGNTPDEIESVWSKIGDSGTKRGALDAVKMARERGAGSVIKQSTTRQEGMRMGGGTKGEDVVKIDTGTRIETPDLGGPAPAKLAPEDVSVLDAFEAEPAPKKKTLTPDDMKALDAFEVDE